MKFILLSFSTWRMASLFAREYGPFGAFEFIRTMSGVRYPVVGEPYAKNEFAEGLICLWCNSVWFSALLVGLAGVFKLLAPEQLLFYWLATSAGAILIDEVING